MKRLTLKIATIVIAILMFITNTVFILAEDNGDGSGGGQGNPLELRNHSISNGQTNVSVNTSISLEFSKNVINASVKVNNMGCFSLKDDYGASHPINVIMADDQVEPDKKRIITISVATHLKEGTNYTLFISKNIRSKSGDNMINDIRLSFTTDGNQKEEQPIKPEEPKPSQPSTSTSNTQENTSSSNDDKDHTKNEIADKESAKNDVKAENDNVIDKSDNEDETSSEERVENLVETSKDNNVENNKSYNALTISLIIVVVIIGVGIYLYMKKVKK